MVTLCEGTTPAPSAAAEISHFARPRAGARIAGAAHRRAGIAPWWALTKSIRPKSRDSTPSMAAISHTSRKAPYLDRDGTGIRPCCPCRASSERSAAICRLASAALRGFGSVRNASRSPAPARSISRSASQCGWVTSWIGRPFGRTDSRRRRSALRKAGRVRLRRRPAHRLAVAGDIEVGPISSCSSRLCDQLRCLHSGPLRAGWERRLPSKRMSSGCIRSDMATPSVAWFARMKNAGRCRPRRVQAP